MTFPLRPSESSGLVTALDAALFGFALLVSLALLAWIGWRRRPVGWMFAAALVPQVAANALLAILLPCLSLSKVIAPGFAGEAVALLLLGPGGLLSATLTVLATRLWPAGWSRRAHVFTGLLAAAIALGVAGGTLMLSVLFDPYADYYVPA